MKMAYVLAKVATSRAQLQNAVCTARACGDSEYVFRNRRALTILNRRVEALVKVLPREYVDEAREITTAPI